jgi:hypothetical protein
LSSNNQGDDNEGQSEGTASMDSIGTQELVTRLQTNLIQQPQDTNTTTKNPIQLEEPSGAPAASADLSNIGTNSGSKGAHQIPTELLGQAGDLTEVAGHGD